MKILIDIDNNEQFGNVVNLLKSFNYNFSLYETICVLNVVVDTETKEVHNVPIASNKYKVFDILVPYDFFMREYWRFLSDKEEFYMQDLNILEEIQNDIKFIKQKLNTAPDEISIDRSGIVIKNYFKEA